MAALAAAAGLSGCARSRQIAFKVDGFSGDVINLGDDRYDKWRMSMPWQLHKPERYPQLILRPRSDQDAQLAVRFAKKAGLPIAVKSGGHHVWAAFLRDGGVLLDLADFRSVQIDSQSGTALVQPAAWSSQVMDTLAASGFAFPVAHCATVPMGGYLLGGGFGINGDTWGPMACSQILGARVLDADGQLLDIDQRREPDLFWALRGAGPGFRGVVLAYRLKLFDLPRAVMSSIYVFPVESAPEVVAWSKSIALAGASKMELLVLLGHNPGAPDNATAKQKKLCIARFAVFGASEEESKRLLAPVAGHPMAKRSLFKQEAVDTTWDNLFIDSVDITSGFGYGHYAVDNLWTDRPEVAVGELSDALLTAPSDRTHVVIQPKSSIALEPDMAFSIARRAYMAWYNVWDRAESTPASLAWSRQTSLRMSRYAEGHYVNELDPRVGLARKLEGSFSPQARDRLQQVGDAYDPDGLFEAYYGEA